MDKAFDEAQFLAALAAIREFQAPDAAALEALRSGSRRVRGLMTEVSQTQAYLRALEAVLDSTLSPAYIFSLNDPKIIGEVIVYKLEQEPKNPIEIIQPFYGSGVYAIYYHGSFPAYAAIANTNCPIYVGKAGPKQATAESPKAQGTSLYGRLSEHRGKSIEKASNLNVAEFTCRYLVVQSGLEKAAEDFLIGRYVPVWNEEAKVCSGLGKHGDIARAEKSSWDILHPGRPWADAQSSRSGETPDKVAGNIQDYFTRLLTADPSKWRAIFNPAWLAAWEARPGS